MEREIDYPATGHRAGAIRIKKMEEINAKDWIYD